jgi:uncharacterized protein
MDRKCPNCGLALKKEGVGSVTIDTCRECGGIWFDEGELRQIQQLGPEQMPQLESMVVPREIYVVRPEGSKLCPVCNIILTVYRYQYTSQIQLDGCEQCGGVWVDEGELKGMAEFLRQEEANAKAKDGTAEARRLAAVAELAAKGMEFQERQQRMRDVLCVLKSRIVYRY